MSILRGFQDVTGLNPEQPGLTLQLTLLGEEGYTRDSLRSLPT